MGFKPRQRRVAVHWNDAAVDYGWKCENSRFRPSPRIVTIGFIVRRTDKVIEVAQSVAEYGQVAEVMQIPLGCVVKVERL